MRGTGAAAALLVIAALAGCSDGDAAEPRAVTASAPVTSAAPAATSAAPAPSTTVARAAASKASSRSTNTPRQRDWHDANARRLCGGTALPTPDRIPNVVRAGVPTRAVLCDYPDVYDNRRQGPVVAHDVDPVRVLRFLRSANGPERYSGSCTADFGVHRALVLTHRDGTRLVLLLECTGTCHWFKGSGSSAHRLLTPAAMSYFDQVLGRR